MQNELTTQEQAIETAFRQLEQECLAALSAAGLKLAPTVTIVVSKNSVELAIENTSPKYGGRTGFGSEVTLYISRATKTGIRDVTINYGTSGSFNPEERNSYWRTMHAATMLQHWDATCRIAQEFAAKYAALETALYV